MSKHALLDVRPVDRSLVERVAHIMGNGSAAAQCLAKASTMRDPMFFEGAQTWFVIERDAFNALIAPSATT